jgi:lysyl-tRNA synthetase class 2
MSFSSTVSSKISIWILPKGIATDVCGSATIQYQGDEFDFSKAFERMSVFDSILQYNPDLCAEDLNAESASTTATRQSIV